jgi:hypothetical protein
VEDTSPRLVYDPDGGSVMVQTTGPASGPAVTVDGLVGDVVFERSTAEGEIALALWLESGQADVLTKMIRYILDKVRITEESKQTLADILPQVEALLERHGAS